MVGYFRPIARKFTDKNIKVEMFDMAIDDDCLLPMSQIDKSLQTADAVILTATSVFNNTFMDIVTKTTKGSDTYILGPSSIMTDAMFDYPNIKAIFGTTFDKKDGEVLSIIENDGGTRTFIKHGYKRAFTPK